METESAVLQLTSMGQAFDDALRQRFGAIRLWEDKTLLTSERAAAVAAIVTSVRYGCDQRTIQALPGLRAICSWGAGVDTIAVDLAKSRGIQISNTPDVLDDCVADLAWGLMLAVARDIVSANQYVRNGEWRELGKFPLSTRISGKRLGILGLGRIGAAVAKRAIGFSMEVRYFSRSHHQDSLLAFEPSLLDLAKWSDFLVVACPGGPATKHLVSSAVFEALGPNGILINVARGSVVDLAALINALEQNKLGGAGLDVIEGEPGAPSRLLERRNVVVTPHVGSATRETRLAMERLVIDNLSSFFRTGRVLNPVFQ
ncbi:hydroxyacid dehydrogenase [Bradyrhizobium retamae]|uniref:Hydroxyacid dehydrogenase n=1 Tax=Bradyrhizobium retamae TaxID=1300035 RepID=A0A0R3MAR6_9BRAD|nr:hydroxyacid dehydrogenase [Bradyrhizobium retamae]